MKNSRSYMQFVVRHALHEDIGRGDITTDDIFGASGRTVKGYLVAGEDLILSGTPLFMEVFRQLGGGARFYWKKKDGEKIRKNTVFCRFEGDLKRILKGERVALNFIQRLSGIATLTARFIKKLNSKNIRIIDTRKTTPLLRTFEKKAVMDGGGTNHRMGLYDMYMIKDNHIKGITLTGSSIVAAARKIREKRRKLLLEIEAGTLKEVEQALQAGADIIMLDNMGIKRVKSALKLIAKKAKVEISGGINISNIAKYSKLPVDYISIGALTHSFKSMDISLEIE